ncbi:uncharacterized protein BXIN_2887 [Babesia sp. Xinjiang]|uniref:uncharacterized protein n=1 Tax=Babesia sp. Xinjiang TaxID=462227 RepID=UPI000A243C85|nr:uncharacterized protein BXIN_2887 [Babesia sp. Xinjiang]ORM39476.1 hypothetical protein BXIN_2887 [Babesia sp. Xinjiang]
MRRTFAIPLQRGLINGLRNRTLPTASSTPSRVWFSSEVVSNVSSWECKVNEFFDAYKKYTDAIDKTLQESSDDLKKRLKAVAKEAAKHIDECDLTTATVLMICLNNISRRCKCVELYNELMRLLLREVSSGTGRNTTKGDDKVRQIIGNFVGEDYIEASKRDESLAALLLGGLRAYELKQTPKQVVDDMIAVANANLYRWAPSELVNVCRDLAWVCRFCQQEGGPGLLRKALTFVCDRASKSATTLKRPQLITLMKAMSVTKQESATLDLRMNHLIAALLAAEEADIPADPEYRLNVQYRRAKGNVHVLHVALISGLELKTNVVQALLDSVMKFCIDYFSATCRMWQMKPPETNYHDYNTIDPRVANLIYAKCTNKVLRVPGSLDPANNPEPKIPKLEERYQAVVAALARLFESGKHTFCRGLKLCEARLRIVNRTIYRDLDDRTRTFMHAVACFRLEDPQPSPSDALQRALTHLRYRPVPLMLDGTFQINCIDHRARLFCELCNEKEAREVRDVGDTGSHLKYNASTDLKLRYLEASGWRGITLLEAEWKRLPEDARIALLRSKLAEINKQP